MKRFIIPFLLGVTVVIAIAATVKISDLPLSTNPSTNTYIEIADMNAVTKSSKFLFNGVTYKSVTNGMGWSGDTNNVIGGDGRERTVASGGQPASATLTNLSNGIGTGLTNLLAAAVQAAQTNVVTTNFIAKTGDTMSATLKFADGLTYGGIYASSNAFYGLNFEAIDSPAINYGMGFYNTWNAVIDWYFSTSAGNTNQGRQYRFARTSSALPGTLSINGDFTQVNDNFGNIGAASSGRPAIIYAATSVVTPKTQIGGTTASFPMLTNSSTSLKARLADDSGDADIISYGANMREGKLVTVTGINVNTNTLQTLYVVPTGKTLIVTKVVLRNASTSLTTASFGIGYDSPAANVIASATHTSLTNSTLYEIVPAKAGAIKGNAADTLGLSCTINQGAAATVDLDVFGFFL